jgi:hypothetical protein
MTESSGLPPEQETVRRLLADARHDGPPPPDVVARLDDTLAALRAERAGADTSPGRVVDIGSRRRRVAGIGLLAAASVVVAGVALGQALPRGGDASDSSAGSASDSSLAEAPTSEDDGGDSTVESSGNLAEGEARKSDESFLEPGLAPGPTLFSDDDDDLVDQLVVLRPDASTGRQRLTSLAALQGCDGVDARRWAAVVPAQVDGELGLVVYRRPLGQDQGVELYVCGTPDPVRTLTLPAP